MKYNQYSLKINELVYALYELGEEEVGIIEGKK